MTTTVCFTGHRPQFMYGYDETNNGNKKIMTWLEQRIRAVVKKHRKVHFISGGALGIDTWAAEAVMKVRNEFPNVTLEIAVPCKNQDKKWRSDAKKRYRQLLDAADKVTMITNKEYTYNCMQVRDEYMVDHANAIISVWTEKMEGGTFNTLEYADKKGLPMLILNPQTFTQIKVKKSERLFHPMDILLRGTPKYNAEVEFIYCEPDTPNKPKTGKYTFKAVRSVKSEHRGIIHSHIIREFGYQNVQITELGYSPIR